MTYIHLLIKRNEKRGPMPPSLGKTKKYWLMKSEPNTYSIYDLKKSGKDLWDGVRNYQARNFMMKDMQIDDEVLFYHSNANPPAVVGLALVSKKAVPDATAFDSKSQYYDPLSTKQKPRWYCVEVKFKALFKNSIPLQKLKGEKKLSKMLLLQKGQRLSVLPVTKQEYMHIVKMSKRL